MIDFYIIPNYWVYMFVTTISFFIGVFLNEIIRIVPIKMFDDWERECRILLTEDLKNDTVSKKKEHFRPQFIPLIKNENLQGSSRIDYRALAIELLTICTSLSIVFLMGISALSILYLIIGWALIALIFIDIDHMLLPDYITLPLLWLVLVASIFELTISSSQAITGAVFGYLSFFSIYWLYKVFTGKEAMGHGDFKLLAIFGALLGWKELYILILLSSILGLIGATFTIILPRKEISTPIPFGPYIAVAGFSLMLGSPHIHELFNLINLNIG